MWQSANVVRAKTHHRTRRRVRHGHHTRIQSSPHVPQGRKCETKLHAKRKAKRPAGARTGTRTSVTTNEDEPTLDRLTSYDDTLIAVGGNTGTQGKRRESAQTVRREPATATPATTPPVYVYGVDASQGRVVARRLGCSFDRFGFRARATTPAPWASPRGRRPARGPARRVSAVRACALCGRASSGRIYANVQP